MSRMNNTFDKQRVSGYAKAAGQHAVRHAIAHNTGDGKALDPGLGMRLFRDKRVPVSVKLASIGLGVVFMMALQIMEIPAQMLLAVILPLVGIGINGVIDGTEAVIIPLLLSTVLLPRLAPKELVAQIREEAEFGMTGRIRRVN